MYHFADRIVWFFSLGEQDISIKVLQMICPEGIKARKTNYS